MDGFHGLRDGRFFESYKYIILLMGEILHQLIGSLSHHLQGFMHQRWCRISSINGTSDVQHSQS